MINKSAAECCMCVEVICIEKVRGSAAPEFTALLSVHPPASSLPPFPPLCLLFLLFSSSQPPLCLLFLLAASSLPPFPPLFLLFSSSLPPLCLLFVLAASCEAVPDWCGCLHLSVGQLLVGCANVSLCCCSYCCSVGETHSPVYFCE